STNWNSAEAASKRDASSSAIARSIVVTHSAVQRALRFAPASSPAGSSMMNSAPTSGRKMMTESIGQLAMSVAPARDPEPGDEQPRPDQPGERVVVEVAGLQPHHVAGDVDPARRDAVRSEAVDQPAVAAAPQQAAEPEGGPHEQEVVDLVEVPLVEQEAVQDLVIAGEPHGDIRLSDIEPVGDAQADEHHDRGQIRDLPADRLHVLQYVIGRTKLERLAEERFDTVTLEQVDEWHSRQDTACPQRPERHQHGHRTLVRRFVVR